MKWDEQRKGCKGYAKRRVSSGASRCGQADGATNAKFVTAARDGFDATLFTCFERLSRVGMANCEVLNCGRRKAPLRGLRNGRRDEN